MTTPRPVGFKFRDMTATLFRDVAGRIELRVIRIGRGGLVARGFFDRSDTSAIAEFCLAHLDDELYFGVALRGAADDGSLDGCVALTALFVDIDFKMTADAEARFNLARCPVQPSLVIASGGGLHPYWFLTEPIVLPGDAGLAGSLLRRLAAYVGGDPSSAEPVHVLRVPGGMNHKYTPARSITIEILEPDRCYNVADFDWLPSEPAQDHPRTAKPAGGKIRPGDRHQDLFAAGRSLRWHGAAADVVLAALLAMNREQCEPPHAERTVREIADAVMGQRDRSDCPPRPDPAADATHTDEAGVGPDGGTLPWARSLPDLIAEVGHTPDEPPLITDFVMASLITLLHGQPRDWKTIVALHVALAVATGRALFGLARLSVPVARNVLYLTEEDGRRRVANRLRLICAGLGFDPPANLFVAAGTGFSLDDPECQGKLAAFVNAHEIGLVIPDPLRSLSACVDQGPKELRPLTLTLRALMRDTGCTIFAVHHDSKPLAVGVDARRRPQRASGGAVFSIADSPIGIDALPDGRRLLAPCAWKFSDDPPSIALAIESGDGFLRLVGADADGATTPGEIDLAGRVLAFLAANPRSSGTAVQKGLQVRKLDVRAALERLAGIGKIDSVKMGRAVLWFVVDEKGPDPCGTHRNEPDSAPDSMGPDSGPIPGDNTGNLNDSMGPDVGTHADPYKTTGPDTGGGPRYGSRSYIGPILGTHATPDPEPAADSASAVTLEPPDEVTPW